MSTATNSARQNVRNYMLAMSLDEMEKQLEMWKESAPTNVCYAQEMIIEKLKQELDDALDAIPTDEALQADKYYIQTRKGDRFGSVYTLQKMPYTTIIEGLMECDRIRLASNQTISARVVDIYGQIYGYNSQNRS